MWSVTSGCVHSDESFVQTCKREVKEELNISLQEDEIQELGYIIYDKPIRYIYYIKKDIDINDIILQKEEVEKVEYLPVEEIHKLIEENKFLDSHSIQFDYLLKRLNK